MVLRLHLDSTNHTALRASWSCIVITPCFLCKHCKNSGVWKPFWNVISTARKNPNTSIASLSSLIRSDCGRQLTTYRCVRISHDLRMKKWRVFCKKSFCCVIDRTSASFHPLKLVSELIMDHLRSIFQDVSFTNKDEVIETLQQEGVSWNFVQ